MIQEFPSERWKGSGDHTRRRKVPLLAHRWSLILTDIHDAINTQTEPNRRSNCLRNSMSRTKVLWESQSRLQATFHFENMPNFNYARRSSTGTNFKPCNRSPSQAWELISFPDILNLGTRLAWKSVCRKTQDTTTSRHSTHISSIAQCAVCACVKMPGHQNWFKCGLRSSQSLRVCMYGKL